MVRRSVCRAPRPEPPSRGANAVPVAAVWGMGLETGNETSPRGPGRPPSAEWRGAVRKGRLAGLAMCGSRHASRLLPAPWGGLSPNTLVMILRHGFLQFFEKYLPLGWGQQTDPGQFRPPFYFLQKCPAKPQKPSLLRSRSCPSPRLRQVGPPSPRADD